MRNAHSQTSTTRTMTEKKPTTLADSLAAVAALSSPVMPAGFLGARDLIGPTFKLPDPPALWMRERLITQIKKFEELLNPEEEVGFFLAMPGSPSAFHIERVGAWGPDMIIFHGTNSDNKPVQLVQHYTQVNVLLTALPKIHEPARRIGFDLDRKDAKSE
jgi:hypothetical protein